MNTEGIWLEKTAWLYLEGFSRSTPIPSNLLSRFGYPDQAVPMYALGWTNMEELLSFSNPSYWNEILTNLQALNSSGFPGLKKEAPLLGWMEETASLRNRKFVVPSIMREIGIGAPPAPDLTGEWLSQITQTCKETSKGPKCKVSGTLGVKNIGNQDAPSSRVRFYLSNDRTYDKDDIFLKQVATGTLKAGKSKAKKLSGSLPPGTTGSGKNIIAVIDADKTVAEANETNNNAVYGPIP
jgi:hypothetical protein